MFSNLICCFLLSIGCMVCNATETNDDCCWICYSPIHDEKEIFLTNCQHRIHRQCARDFWAHEKFILKCGICRKDIHTHHLANLYDCKQGGYQIYIKLELESNTKNTFEWELVIENFQLKFQDLQYVIYWKERTQKLSGGNCNAIMNIIASGSYVFVFAGKIMKNGATLESVDIKKESTIFWVQCKESKFNVMKAKVLRDSGNDNAMEFQLKDLNLDAFMINPTNMGYGFTVNFKFHNEYSVLENLRIFVNDDESTYVFYCFKSVRDRIKSYSFVNRLWMFWSTLNFDMYSLKNFCILVFPNEEKIEIRELYHPQRILETFTTVKTIQFYPGVTGAQDLFQNLVLIPPSMKHNSVLKFWKNKQLREINVYHIFVIFVSILVGIFLLKKNI